MQRIDSQHLLISLLLPSSTKDFMRQDENGWHAY